MSDRSMMKNSEGSPGDTQGAIVSIVWGNGRIFDMKIACLEEVTLVAFLCNLKVVSYEGIQNL